MMLLIKKINLISVSIMMMSGLGIDAASSDNIQHLSQGAVPDPEVISILSKSGYSIEPLTGISHTGNTIIVDGLSFSTNEHQAKKFIDKYYKVLKAKGYHLFRQERGYNYINDRVGIIKSADQFDILQVRKTHAYTHNLSTLQITEKLKHWNKRYGIVIIGAGYNWLNIKFNRLPKDLPTFTDEVLDFCPEVLQFSAGTVEQLAQAIQTERSLFLQWN